MIECGIYSITNKINGKQYFGSTNNWYKRKATHISPLKSGTHKNIHLQRAWNKYGADNFEFKFELEVYEPYLYWVEQIYLNVNKGYNIAVDAAASARNRKLSTVHKNRISASLMGHKVKKETILKFGKNKKGYYFDRGMCRVHCLGVKKNVKTEQEAIELVKQIRSNYARK